MEIGRPLAEKLSTGDGEIALIALHVGADALIALAYFSIPLALLRIVRRREDLAHRPMFALFAAFILASGASHLISVWTLWWPDWWFAGGVKALVAVVSLATAALLWRAMPAILALPSRHQLQVMNSELRIQMEQREQAVLAMLESEARFHQAFDFAPIGMGLVGRDGGWLQVNPALCRTLGYDEPALRARGVAELLQDDASLDDLFGGRRMHIWQERRCLRSDGGTVWLQIALSAVPDPAGKPLYLIAHVHDVTEQRAATELLRNAHAELERRVAERTAALEESNRRLERLARYDSLTGLLNRHHLMERLGLAIAEARRYRYPLSLMMVDLDRFKTINDSHGHQAGDQAIARAGHVLRQQLRATDLAGRYGGDEFCVVLPHTGPDEARAVAEKLRAALRQAPLILDGGETVPLACSIGLACLGADDNAKSLLAAADARLYEAKEAGRDRVEAAPT